MRRAWLLAASIAVWAPSQAHANPLKHVHPSHPGHHHAAYPNLIGLKIGTLSLIEPEEGGARYVPGYIAGLSYERTLVHEWLELELSLPAAITFGETTGLSLPLDVHLKKPFHPSKNLSPYIAVGPVFDFRLRPDPGVSFGGSLAVGTYFWLSRRMGIDLELDYNVLAERGEAVHELVAAAGPVFRL